MAAIWSDVLGKAIAAGVTGKFRLYGCTVLRPRREVPWNCTDAVLPPTAERRQSWPGLLAAFPIVLLHQWQVERKGKIGLPR
jgi:hypothetical protein